MMVARQPSWRACPIDGAHNMRPSSITVPGSIDAALNLIYRGPVMNMACPISTGRPRPNKGEKMSEDINSAPGHYVRPAVKGIVAAERDSIGSAEALSSRINPSEVPPIKPGTSTSFGPLKQIDAGLLNVGYVEAGPTDGPAVILLHGWPYDIHSYLDVAPLLASAGYRVIVPYLRGYGTTRFLSSETFRNGQQSVITIDILAFMDALKIDKAILAGFDWGARTADIMAALWPERCKALVSVSGYLIVNLEANLEPLPPMTELGWWYQGTCRLPRVGSNGYGTGGPTAR